MQSSASSQHVTHAQLRLNFFHGHGQKHTFPEEVFQFTVLDSGSLKIGLLRLELGMEKRMYTGGTSYVGRWTKTHIS